MVRLTFAAAVVFVACCGMRQAFVPEVNRPTLAECPSGAVEEHSSSKSLTRFASANQTPPVISLPAGRRSRLAHDEFRFDQNFGDVLYSSLDAF